MIAYVNSDIKVPVIDYFKKYNDSLGHDNRFGQPKLFNRAI